MYYSRDLGMEYTPEGQPRYVYLNQPVVNYAAYSHPSHQANNNLESGAIHPLLYHQPTALLSAIHPHNAPSTPIPLLHQAPGGVPPTGTVFYTPGGPHYLQAATGPLPSHPHHTAQHPFAHHQDAAGANNMFALNHAFTQLSMADSAALVYTGQPIHHHHHHQQNGHQPGARAPHPLSLSKPVFLGGKTTSPPSLNGYHQPPSTNHSTSHRQNNNNNNTTTLTSKKLSPTAAGLLNGDFDLSQAVFFVIKSYSEEDVQRSIRHSIWCSTDHGNRRLDAAFRSLLSLGGAGAGHVLLFFSVNGSGKFCGVAEMTSPVDYGKCSGIWAQTKWRGEFRVHWHIIKDVPNSCLRHIRIETNEDRPVTNSRDATPLPPDKGSQLFALIRNYKSTASLQQLLPLQQHHESSSGHREVKNGGSHQQPTPTPVKILKPPNRSEN